MASWVPRCDVGVLVVDRPGTVAAHVAQEADVDTDTHGGESVAIRACLCVTASLRDGRQRNPHAPPKHVLSPRRATHHHLANRVWTDTWRCSVSSVHSRRSGGAVVCAQQRCGSRDTEVCRISTCADSKGDVAERALGRRSPRQADRCPEQSRSKRARGTTSLKAVPRVALCAAGTATERRCRGRPCPGHASRRPRSSGRSR